MSISRNKPAATAKTPETKPATQAVNPPVTFDLNDPAFQAIVTQAVTARLAAIEAEEPAKMSIAGKSEASIKNEIQTVRAFRRIGISDAKPHVNIFTFNKWASQGFRPIEGSKSVKVANLRLFHVSQVRKLTEEERGTMQAQSAAAVARNEKPKGNGKAASVHQLKPQQGALL
jgi:hypothetical protein